MEEIICRAMVEHMISNKLLSDSQHEFIHDSIYTQLLQVFDRLSELILMKVAIYPTSIWTLQRLSTRYRIAG